MGREWRFAWIVSLVLVVLTTIPYVFGYFVTPLDRVYTGGLSMSMIDTDVYYSYINQAAQGRFLFESLATTLPEPRVIFSPFWLVTGWVSAVGFSEIIANQVVRILLIPVCVLGCYYVLSGVFTEVRLRKIALVLLCFTSGFGFFFAWLFNETTIAKDFLNGFYYWPPDIWVPEAFFFLSAYRSGHFLLGTLLLILVFFFLMRAQKNKDWKDAVHAGWSALFLLSFHPYHAPTLAIVCLVYLVFRFVQTRRLDWRFLGYAVIVGGMSLPAIGYYLWLVRADWVKEFHSAANITLTTAPELTLLSYGCSFLLALIPLYLFFVKKKRFAGMDPVYFDFFLCWFVGQFLAFYTPLLFQRRLTQGWQFPIIVFASMGLVSLFVWIRKKYPSFQWKLWIPSLGIFFFLFFASSNVLVVLRDLGVMANSTLLSMRYDTADACVWIQKNTPTDATFLVSYIDLQFVPAFGLRKVYQFHPHETPLSASKEAFMDWFFLTNTSDAHKYAFLKENNIQYVWYNRDLVIATKNYMGTQNNLWFFQNIFEPQEKSYLEEVYVASDALRLFKVKE